MAPNGLAIVEHIGKELEVLQGMKFDRTKCGRIINNACTKLNALLAMFGIVNFQFTRMKS